MSSFHGWMRKNKDGSNRIIEKGKRCLCPTVSPFWKKTVDVSFKVSTRSQEYKKELVKRADFNRYCRQRGRPGRLLFKRIRQFFRYWIILIILQIYCILLIFIVNNGNILRDGRTRYYKKSQELKCNKYIYSNKLLTTSIENTLFLINHSGSKTFQIFTPLLNVQNPIFFKFCSVFFKFVTVFAYIAKVAGVSNFIFFFC